MSTYLWDILDPSELSQMVDEGYVRVQTHPVYPYSIACYTKQAMFERKWNNTTMTCRGLIWRQDNGRVLARPFKKFFNYGEPNAPEFSPDDWVTVYDKTDGSLGIAYDTPEGPAIATKGSFASEQAIHATKLLRTVYPRYDTEDGITDLFEIIYPENRIVLDYGDADELRYLGSVWVDDGTDFWNGMLIKYWDIPVNHFLLQGTWPDVTQLIDLNRPNAEGVVIHNECTGERLKLKQQDYIKLHKVMTGLNEKQLWQWASDGKTYDKIMESIPEELHSWAEPILKDLFQRVAEIWEELESLWEAVPYELTQNRKAFAIWANQWSALYKSCLFMLLDRQDKRVRELIWKAVKP